MEKIKSGICFIVGAGDYYGMQIKPGKDDFIIAADGGLTYLSREGIVPDNMIGDFDSLGYTPEGDNVTVLPAMKDDTDMMIAVKSGLGLGYKTFVIYGGMGGRMAHTVANIDVLTFISMNGGIGYLMGDGQTVTAIQDSIEFSEDYSGYISIFTRGDIVKGITLKGLKYPLNKYDMSIGNPIGVSNEFTGECANISIEEGILLVIYEDNYEYGLPKTIN